MRACRDPTFEMPGFTLLSRVVVASSSAVVYPFTGVGIHRYAEAVAAPDRNARRDGLEACVLMVSLHLMLIG